jgi:putative FmdB family regulatory protein
MPTYAYKCQACGTEFDQYQKYDDSPLTRCPNCKKLKLRRVFAPAAIVFKGSGWYKTDSRSKSTSTSVRGDKPAEKAAEAPAASKPSENGSNGSGDGTTKTAAPKKDASPAAKSGD